MIAIYGGGMDVHTVDAAHTPAGDINDIFWALAAQPSDQKRAAHNLALEDEAAEEVFSTLLTPALPVTALTRQRIGRLTAVGCRKDSTVSHCR